MNLKTDCRFILWDRPCKFHKESGVECDACTEYKPIANRILIIKLEAMGDVLRTTSILDGLKIQYPDSFITWITLSSSQDLLKNNPYVDRVLCSELDISCVLQKEEFDLVLNPDTSPRSALLASCAKSKKKLGFEYKDNKVVPLNKEAEIWYYMGLNDKIKKANEKTYQDIILSMFSLTKGKRDIILNLSEQDRAFGKRFAKKNNIDKSKPVIGINTGAGKRWKFKSWSMEHTITLIEDIYKKTKANIILFGGPDERDRNKAILKRIKAPVIDAGTENSLRGFMALVDLCDLLVVTDSLALHIALGLGKKAVVLFGPTSSKEIDLYGKGISLVSSLDCVCCYKKTCDKDPNCMDLIEPEKVLSCVQKLL